MVADLELGRVLDLAVVAARLGLRGVDEGARKLLVELAKRVGVSGMGERVVQRAGQSKERRLASCWERRDSILGCG